MPGTLVFLHRVVGVSWDDGLSTLVSEAFEQAIALKNLLPEFSLMK